MANLLRVTQEFKNSEELHKVITEYENMTNYHFGKSDSRKIATHCQSLGVNADEYQHLGYYYIYMRCSRGGQHIEKKKNRC